MMIGMKFCVSIRSYDV